MGICFLLKFTNFCFALVYHLQGGVWYQEAALHCCSNIAGVEIITLFKLVLETSLCRDFHVCPHELLLIFSVIVCG